MARVLHTPPRTTGCDRVPTPEGSCHAARSGSFEPRTGCVDMTWHRFPGRGSSVRLALGAAILVGVAAACSSDSTGPLVKSAQVRVLLTDAPSDMLDSANVFISRIYLQGGEGEEPDTAESDSTESDSSSVAARVDLYNDPENPLELNLLDLQNGVTADLTGLTDVDVGNYRSLRLVVDSARVMLKDPYLFEDSTNTASLKIPSGHASGIKVKLNDVILATEGETTTITVDFPVNDNFIFQMDHQSGLVRKVMFKPVLREKHRESHHD